MLSKLFILAIFCKFAFSNNDRFNIRESKQISTTETEFNQILGYVKGITVLGSFNRHDSSQFGFASINGLIDPEQQKVIQTPFKIVNNKSISKFAGTAENSDDYFNLIPVIDDDKGKLGFIDREGKVVISPIFDYDLQYSYGSACGQRYSGLFIDGEPVIFDCKNRKVTKHKFDAVGDFHEGRAKVRLENKTNMSNASK